ncbi:uncharacterized protein LOC130509059 [Raphanus sativus]|uniref:Uncharacterized protein LOC130509059 n=1 Tax=Raphanus sativus TaxID=3726 RepID=A0A9W3D9P3_RAPSA|nr:uncharacterized protein LOC130509059 [Raphanus sativus]
MGFGLPKLLKNYGFFCFGETISILLLCSRLPRSPRWRFSILLLHSLICVCGFINHLSGEATTTIHLSGDLSLAPALSPFLRPSLLSGVLSLSGSLSGVLSGSLSGILSLGLSLRLSLSLGLSDVLSLGLSLRRSLSLSVTLAKQAVVGSSTHGCANLQYTRRQNVGV